MRGRCNDVTSSVVGLHFYIGRGNCLGYGLFPVETTARSLGHQAKEPGHGHLYERRRVLERFGENPGGQRNGRTKRRVNEHGTTIY